MSDNKFYIVVDGERVPVSEQVYKAYHYYTRKEKYFTCDLKKEEFVCDQETQTAAFIPSREDSYERLLEANEQFSTDDMPVDDQAVWSVWMQKIMLDLNEEERQIIHHLYYLDKTEREASAVLHLPLSTFQRRKKTLLKKLRKIVEKKFSEIF